jgi:hypothetical protein
MRKLVLAAAALAALVATTAPQAAGTSVVGAYACYLNGGHVERPAGTDVVVRFGWAAKTRGLVQDYLAAQTTAIAVDGGPPVDLSAGYDTPAPSGDGWASFVDYDTGVVLAAGESTTFDLTLDVSHRLTDGITFANGESGMPLFGGPGELLAVHCTVTGV